MRRMKMALAVALLGLLGANAHAQSTILQEAEQRGTLRIAVIGSNPPFSVINPNGEPEGFDIDMARKLADSLKLQPEFIVTDTPGRITSLVRLATDPADNQRWPLFL